MADPARGAVRASRLETFHRILRLEEERGYGDRAVMGGLDRFLAAWRQELEQEPQGALLDHLTRLGVFQDSYASRTVEDRGAWASRVLEELASAPDASAKARAAAYRPRKPRPVPPGHSLNRPASVLPGVGPTIASKLEAVGVHSVRDLLYHYPRRHIPIVWLRDLAPGEEQGVVGTVWEARAVNIGGPRRQSTEAVLSDETGNLRVVWFNQGFVARSLRVGERVFVTGHVRIYRGQRTLEASGYETLAPDDDAFRPGRLAPVYPSTEGLTQRTLRRVVRRALDEWLPRLEDHMPQEVGERQDLLHLADALAAYHYPEDGPARSAARTRLAFDELFLVQLCMLARKADWQKQGSSIPVPVREEVLRAFLDALPFRFTAAQDRVLDETLTDMGRTWPMGRLLQGEVGSGKTVVALAAMLMAAAHGCQAALMAPTEVLAEQHYLTIGRLLEGFSQPVQEPNALAVTVGPLSRPIVIALLLGSQTAREKEEVRGRLKRHEIDIVVGTHALIQRDVTFPRLALAVVDEQQRFGVMQRRALGERGTRPHLMTMSATPIPRSLALSLYGDLDVSVLDELPPGRQPVRTKWLRPDQREQAYRYLRGQVEEGRQAFVVCPLIEESETLQTRAAQREHRRLSEEVYPDLRVGLLHGRMSLAEKVEVMDSFRERALDILVATPVVEVGVDIPNATAILVEGADRFGLSELHQFRGRVGRGEHPGACLLQADDPSPEARGRLAVLEQETSGFRVAEEDLRLRGPGEFFGIRQSGLPDLKLAGLGDLPLLGRAREEAARLLAEDPDLSHAEHRALAAATEPLRRALAEHGTAGE